MRSAKSPLEILEPRAEPGLIQVSYSFSNEKMPFGQISSTQYCDPTRECLPAWLKCAQLLSLPLALRSGLLPPTPLPSAPNAPTETDGPFGALWGSNEIRSSCS